MKKTKKIVCSLLIVLSFFLLAGCGNKKDELKDNDNNNEIKENDNNNNEIKENDKSIKIVDLNSNKRVYAVMINNNHGAWPLSGLNDAFLVYEIMVEGGITRMLALYTQDVNVEKIGSVRSARHNYLDYAMENDAIFVHWGDSIYANEDMKKLKTEHIDGMVYGSKYFYTDSSLDRSLEHTRFTSSEQIIKGIAALKLRDTSDKGYLLNYTTDVVDLSTKEGAVEAKNISIKYSNYQTSSYKYNEETKTYDRFMSNKEDVDLVTNKQYSYKNIIVYSVKYDTISSGGHQDLKNIGSGEGYYITNGYAVPINWSKKDRSSKTVYTYKDGNEIDVSDGNTFIQIYPTSASELKIS